MYVVCRVHPEDVADGRRTAALVVQHLFENCVQEDTRDCLEEIFEGFNTVVRDQWGSFVIQHSE